MAKTSKWDRKRESLQRMLTRRGYQEQYPGEITENILASDPDLEQYSNSHWLLRCLIGTKNIKPTATLTEIACRHNMLILETFRDIALLGGQYNKDWFLCRNRSFDDLRNVIQNHIIFDFYRVGFCARDNKIEIFAIDYMKKPVDIQRLGHIDSQGLHMLADSHLYDGHHSIQDILFLLGYPIEKERQAILETVFYNSEYMDNHEKLYPIIYTMALSCPQRLAAMVNTDMPRNIATLCREVLYRASQFPARSLSLDDRNLIVVNTWRKYWSAGHVQTITRPQEQISHLETEVSQLCDG